jgi:hypothetical protein
MKKIILVLGFIGLTLVACSQAEDQTFNKIIWVKQGIKFGDNTIQTTAMTGTGTVTWNAITGKPTFATVATSGSYNDLLNKPLLFDGTWTSLSGKPLTFPPAAHNHDLDYKPITYVPDYSEITNKPTTVELVDAIAATEYLVIPKLSTDQIILLTPRAGMFIYDLTLNVLKIYNGTEWKILITNQ